MAHSQTSCEERRKRDRMDDKMKVLLELSSHVVDYLQKNFHPHTTVVIEVDSIRVEETLTSVIKEYAVN